MPTVGDLHRVRQGLCCGFAISSATIASDDRDRGMSRQPGLGGRGLAIRQQRDDPAPFQVADDAGVSMITPPRPVIDADDLETIGRRMAAASDDTQKRVLAYWQHQPFCEARRRSPPKRQTEVMDDGVQPCRPSRRWREYPFGEAFREDLATA